MDLCYANNREDYSRQMLSYCQSRDIDEEHQLAPLPLLTWIKRHGMDWNYWYYAETLSSNNPFIFISLTKQEQPHTPVTTTSYLIERKFSISKLDRQFSKHFPCITPKEFTNCIDNNFFSDIDWYADYEDIYDNRMLPLNNRQEVLHYYLIVDAQQSFFFPTQFENLKNKCLYKGKSYESSSEIAPYLIKVQSGDMLSRDFVRQLFTDDENELFGFWNLNPAIFIRSFHDFDTVFSHLRKFTHLLGKTDDGADKWYFFRFYDPAVLASYLQGIGRYPNHLKSFLGIRDNKVVIERFGLRLDNDFYDFSVAELPADSVPAKIEYGKLEKEIFIQFNWERLKKRLLTKIIDIYGNMDSLMLEQWLEEMKNKDLIVSEITYFYYLCGRVLAEKKQINYFHYWDKLSKEKNLSEVCIAETLLNELEK
ncbi:MAG: hypothetical protein CR960_01350 [Pasteurellales bacterium]|nr:MAG: hypothetical protein CR960_01350 [Pasteurellales bacterium]